MTITIRLAKVEYEVLKEPKKKDKMYRKGLAEKVENDILGNNLRPIAWVIAVISGNNAKTLVNILI